MWSETDRNSMANYPKRRTMGTAENALIETSLQYRGHMKVGQLLQLRGPYICLETLRAAIDRLQRRHPFLRTRVQNNPARIGTYFLEEDNTFRPKILEFSRKQNDRFTFWRQEWQNRQTDPVVIGQGLIEFWLLQDPNEREDENSFTEIGIIGEHSICDGLSLSTLAHELLLSLSQGDIDMFGTSLNYPIAMEEAVRRSLSTWSRVILFSKSLFAMIRWSAINNRPIARIPLNTVDFPLNDMAKYCFTSMCYGQLNKEQTQTLLDKCRRENVTVNSAVSIAILCSSSMLLDPDKNQETQLVLAIAADTRRRCVPPISNHDLSYQVSGTMAFALPTKSTPTTPQSMWELAKVFGDHVKASIDAGQTLALAMIIGKLYQKNLGPLNLRIAPTCGISNWGSLPFHEQYGKWELIDMIPLINMIRAPMPFVIIQTVNGKLTISSNGSVPIISLNTLENLYDRTMHNLHQMIES